MNFLPETPIQGVFMRLFLISMCLVTLIFSMIFAQSDESVISARFISSVEEYIPGDSYSLAIEVTIQQPFHINAQKPSEEFLIPTTLKIDVPEGVAVGKMIFPKALVKKFEFSEKPLAVYEETFHIYTTLSISSDIQQTDLMLEGTLGYQACDHHTCMAPSEFNFNQKYSIAGSDQELKHINQEIFSAQPQTREPDITSPADDGSLASTITEKGWILTFLLVFVAGLALNLTPCVYPLIPITISYFGGQAEGKKGGLIIHALIYVLGMAITYSILGVLAALSGNLFGAALQNPFVLVAIAIIMITLALSMFDLYEIRVPTFLTNFAGGAKQGYFGTFFMGLTVGIVAAPCIGPFVLALLTYVGERGDVVLGFSMFFVLALGLGVPFIFLAMFSGSLNKIPRSGAWMVWVRNIFGFVLIGMAIYFLQPLFPSSVLYYLALAFTALIGGIYMAWLEPTQVPGKTFGIIRNLIGIFFFILSMVFFSYSIEAAVEVSASSSSGINLDIQNKVNWKSYSEELLQQARREKMPVMLDFYADWCIPCKELDKFTFSQAEVIEISHQFLMMKVDLTKAGDPQTQAWRNKYNIKGVPTLVFLKPSLEEMKDLRVVGFVEKEDFLPIMKKALESETDSNVD
jgi:thiol:disulfide interchange protein DsbD